MKTIELVCGGKPVQFTTRSVTFDGKEYFYSMMSGVSHNEEERFYTFRYGDEIKKLPYEAKDIKVFQVIFKQVQTLEAQKIATQQLSVAAVAAAEAKEAERKRLEAEKEAKEAEADKPKELTKEEKKAAKLAEKEAKKEAKDPEKAARKKKSLIKFIVVLIVFVLISVGYYAIFGTSDAPNANTPAGNESQQYDDIDEIINDLQ